MQKTVSPIDNKVYIEREYHSNKIEETKAIISKNEIIDAFVRYASSQGDESSVFVKAS